MKKINWQFVIIMITLISWIALFGRWSGKIEAKVNNIAPKVINNELSNTELKIEVIRLTDQLKYTNEILTKLEEKINVIIINRYFIHI